MRITAVGSWPGIDMEVALRQTWSVFEDLPVLPELPERGLGAERLGRTLAMMGEFPTSLVAGRWQTSDTAGIDIRRAETVLRSDLDCLEEFAHSHTGPVKVSVVGPWGVAARVGLRHGEKLLVDHGARHDALAAWIEGVRGFLLDVARRLPASTVVLQIDDVPGEVAAGRVRTASGLRCYDPIDADEIMASYRLLRRELENVLWLRQVGRESQVRWAEAFDVLACEVRELTGGTLDALSQRLDAGRQVAVGVLSSAEVDVVPRPDHLAERVEGRLKQLGMSPEILESSVWLTPSGGFAGWKPDVAAKACQALTECAGAVSERLQ